MPTYKLHFIRHGITQGNVDGIYIGVLDQPLCEMGRMVIERMAEGCIYPKVGRVYTSPLLRCTQTAEILFPYAKAKVMDDLREFHFGDFEGKNAAELLQDAGYSKWIEEMGDMNTRPPGGIETNQEFKDRLDATLYQIVEELGRMDIHEAAVIAHGGVISNYFYNHTLPQKPIHYWVLSNGMGFTARVDLDRWISTGIFEHIGQVPEFPEEVLEREWMYDSADT